MKIEVLSGFWLDIQPHLEREAVFIVDQNLDLADVAEKVASDDVNVVSRWIQEKAIARPTAGQVAAWNKEGAKAFTFVIVQPYVLVQEQSH